MEIVPGKGARMCVCREAQIRSRRLAAIPPKFARLKLSTLEPDLNAHPMQAEIVPYVREHPEESYLLAGRFGCGKTTLMWLMYRNAIKQTARRVVACTLTELLDEYKAFIQASQSGVQGVMPRLNAAELKQSHTKYSIFLDDLDKARPTEYAAEQIFEILNAIYEFQHQLVVTTNLTVKQLADHFDRADFRFGGAIVRRLVDGANVWEMF
jgi:DNA replication protein DnaC